MRSLVLAALCALPLSAAQAQQAPKNEKLNFSGVARNVTVARDDSVSLEIWRNRHGVYRAKGVFGGETLIGDFEAWGRLIEACDEGHICLSFNGALEVGSIDTLWPPGTKTPLSLSIALDLAEGEALGVYDLGPLPGVDYNQHGAIWAQAE